MINNCLVCRVNHTNELKQSKYISYNAKQVTVVTSYVDGERVPPPGGDATQHARLQSQYIHQKQIFLELEQLNSGKL